MRTLEPTEAMVVFTNEIFRPGIGNLTRPTQCPAVFSQRGPYRAFFLNQDPIILLRINPRQPLHESFGCLFHPFQMALSSLIRSGVPLIKTLEVTAAVSGNEIYYQMWMEARAQVVTGREIADTLEEQAILPSDVLQMIRAGEVSGKLDYTLDHVVEFYNGELEADIHKVTVMIEPLMIVIMWVASRSTRRG